MILLLLQQSPDEDLPWGLAIWVVIFFVLPVLGKILGWIMEKVSPGATTRREDQKRMRERREEPLAKIDEVEDDAAEEFEVPLAEPAPEPMPPPQPVAVTAAPARALASDPDARFTDLPSEEIVSSSGEDHLGRLRGLPAPAEPALGGLETRRPIGDGEGWTELDRGRYLEGLRTRVGQRVATEEGIPSRGGGLELSPETDFWRQAILLQEILSAPVGLRSRDATGTPPGLA